MAFCQVSQVLSTKNVSRNYVLATGYTDASVERDTHSAL